MPKCPEILDYVGARRREGRNIGGLIGESGLPSRADPVPSTRVKANTSRQLGPPSRQDLLHHVAGDVRQPEIAALETVGEPLVVDP